MAKGMSPKHTAVRRGTLVLIKTRDGNKIVDKFIERKGGTIHLQQHGRIKKSEMRSFTPYKQKHVPQPNDSKTR
jgi:hypothetical protein